MIKTIGILFICFVIVYVLITFPFIYNITIDEKSTIKRLICFEFNSSDIKVKNEEFMTNYINTYYNENKEMLYDNYGIETVNGFKHICIEE